ncbi:MAG: bifunctional diaminohydroxyphosphoribosylaminopyrimidine deaminase/5-amino-6-(5-phosphoribosylamino)uracil reductase RibD [Gammaproteobacteria bacterium]|nr:bifunctional diaminohydroxyphosphoribosylaminopyrimidine deaminase/5-amino-6-(5-phosphoribosylamino)uracil reductase RibD [Gammaproteobacteria bacterium]
MGHALQLARRGQYTAHPNPRVGCVIVRDGKMVGSGWHREAGTEHAEIHALNEAGSTAEGATVYVTLEPCAHHGRTPPCCDALIAAGVARVVAAMEDPFKKVSGKGLKALRRAGIEVSCGLLRNAAAAMNEGFISRVERGRPFVRLKVACSLDGCTAMADGHSQWITGPQARADVQRLRAASGAILTGIGTVLADDPSLTVREPDLVSRQPLRVIADSRLRMPPSACMLELPGETLVFCINDENRQALEARGATVCCMSGAGQLSLAGVLQELGKLDVNDLLVEAGQTLAGTLLTEELVDELVIYQAPHIMGSETRGMFSTPLWEGLEQKMALSISDMRRVGADMRITARPAPAS